MSGQWRVRRARRKDGSLYLNAKIWNVNEPNGEWSGSFETWDEAMYWATSITSRVENYLQVQARREAR